MSEDSLLTADDVPFFQLARPAEDACNVGDEQGAYCAALYECETVKLCYIPADSAVKSQPFPK